MKKTYLLFILLCSYLIIFLAFAQAEEKVISLNLDEVMSIAINNNLDIKLAKIDADFKKSDLDLTKSVFDTILSAEANYEDDQFEKSSSFYGTKALTTNYNFGVSKKLKTGTTIDFNFTNKREHSNSTFITTNPAHTSVMEVTATQPIGKNFFGLIDRGDVKVVKLNIEKADLESLNRIEDSLAKAEIEYWNLIFAHKVVDLKRKVLERAESLYKVYSDRFSRGMAEKPDVYASKANVKIRQIVLEEAENEVLNKISALKLSLNIDYGCYIKPQGKLELKPHKSDFIRNLKEAIEMRRDYQAAHKKAQAQNLDVVLKRNNLWPEIDLVASFKRNGVDEDGHTAINDIFDENNRDYYLGVNISLPLENREAKSKYQKALLDKEKALISLKKLELMIAGELDRRVREVNIDAEKINKWTKIADLQQDKLKEEEKRFRYGRSNSDTLIRFQNDLLDAQENLARSYLEYHISKVELEVAKNTLLNKLSQENILDIGK